MHELQVRIYFYCTSYELLFTYELRVAVYSKSYELLLLKELQVTVYCMSYELLIVPRVTNFILTMSYNKYRHDEVVYDNNYSLRSFFDKELGLR